MQTEKRVYRTNDGELVREGDPRAAYLAYGASDDVENRDVKAVEALFAEKATPKRGRPPGSKNTPKPENKQAPKPDDK